MTYKLLNSNDIWRPENSFGTLKEELLKLDPVAFMNNYLTIDGHPLNLNGNGWKFTADIARHITTISMSDHGKPIVIVKGRQVGATTLAGGLDIYLMASGICGTGNRPPIRVMHCFPQLELMYSFSKDRLEKMINNSKQIKDFKDPKQPGKITPFVRSQIDSLRDSTDTLQYKQFKNGNTLMCESIGNEGTRVLGRSFDFCFFDEVQDMTEVAVGKTTKCLTRAQYGPQPGGVQVYFGTPRQKGTFFYRLWEQSDQRRFYLGCVECKNYFLLYTPGSDRWEKEIWLYENIVKCPTCGCEQEKIGALERGKWIPTPGREDAQFVGYHFNQLYIPEFSKEVILAQKPENNPLNSEQVWNTEVLGEFHSGQGMPITFEEIYQNCKDSNRAMSKGILPGKKISYFGVDWGGKPDMDGMKRGKSYTCGVVLTVENDELFTIEYAEKLKELSLDTKLDFVERMFRLYGIRSAMGDIGFSDDLSGELKKIYGEKFKTVRSASLVSGGIKYNKDELEIVVEKDKLISEIFELLRKGRIRFPWASYERIVWLVRQCCSMESKLKERNGVPYQAYIKGKEQNDGLMALMYAYLAYKFDKTRGFKMNSTGKKVGIYPKTSLAYLPKLR